MQRSNMVRAMTCPQPCRLINVAKLFVQRNMQGSVAHLRPVAHVRLAGLELEGRQRRLQRRSRSLPEPLHAARVSAGGSCSFPAAADAASFQRVQAT